MLKASSTDFRTSSLKLTYHELAHYYFKSTIGPQWLTEGGAEFLNFYTLNLTEGGTIDADYINGQGVIGAACAPDGSANVHGWNETGAGSNLCPYWLGHQPCWYNFSPPLTHTILRQSNYKIAC